jgi:hypothetical protein
MVSNSYSGFSKAGISQRLPLRAMCDLALSAPMTLPQNRKIRRTIVPP